MPFKTKMWTKDTFRSYFLQFQIILCLFFIMAHVFFLALYKHGSRSYSSYKINMTFSLHFSEGNSCTIHIFSCFRSLSELFPWSDTLSPLSPCLSWLDLKQDRLYLWKITKWYIIIKQSHMTFWFYIGTLLSNELYRIVTLMWTQLSESEGTCYGLNQLLILY